jgi:polyhydroxyalkanoate synthesis regulator phasin
MENAMNNLVAAPVYVNVDFHVKLINDLVSAIPKARADIAQCKLLIGQHIKLIREARPNNWIEIVKSECNLGRRSAYNYLAIAEGKPAEQHRAENRERVARHRALRNAQNGVDVKQAQIDKLNALVDCLKAEIAELKNEKALQTENQAQRIALEKISTRLGEAHALAAHLNQNRNAVLGKMGSAKRAADTALKASNGKALTSNDKGPSLFAKAMSVPGSMEVH